MENAEEKIRSLLAQGSEHEKLDYKRTLNLDEKHDEVEITKDIAAMLSSGGGSLLVGADDFGKPTNDFSDELLGKFDETKLRGKLKKYINEPFDVRLITASFDGFNFALIECTEYSEGFVILKQLGQYRNGEKDKVIFKAGDVFVRHGSASELWQQHDVRRIIQSQVSKAKLEWIDEVRPVTKDESGVQIATSKQILKKEIKNLKAAIREGSLNRSDIEISLDKISSMSINAVQTEDDELYFLTLSALHDCFGLGFDLNGRWLLNNGFNPVDLWYEILIRIPLIGGVCIENRRFELIKDLVLKEVIGEESVHYTNWYRFMLTMSYRHRHLSSGDRDEAKSILSVSTGLFRENELYKNLLDWDPDEGRTYLVRFDYLANLIIIDSAKSVDSGNWYPSFAFYEKRRIEQMLYDVLLNEKLFKQLFSSSKNQIAHAIISMDTLANIEGGHSWRTPVAWNRLSNFFEQPTSY